MKKTQVKNLDWKNIDKTKSYFLEEIEQKELMSKKHKTVCTTLYYIEQLLVLASAITGCISTSAFASLLGTPVGITTSAAGLNFCNSCKIKNYKSLIKKKKKKQDKKALLAKFILNSIEVLVSKALIDANISHNEFDSTNNVLKIWQCEKRSKKFKELNSLSKILVHL